MAGQRERGRLAMAADRLNAASGVGDLPALILLTDDERLDDPISAARALPRGSMVIVRSRDPARREALTRELMRMAPMYRHRVLVAGDPALASRCDAHGLHLPEIRAGEARHWRALHPGWTITCSAHALGALARAGRYGADAALLTPIFPTASHLNRLALGPMRLGHLTRLLSLPVYALGGIDCRSAARLRGLQLAGLAAISALDPAAGPGRTRHTTLRP